VKQEPDCLEVGDCLFCQRTQRQPRCTADSCIMFSREPNDISWSTVRHSACKTATWARSP